MLEPFFQLSKNYIRNYQQEYLRYFLKKESLSNRFSIISGQRGIGKTTTIMQYIQQHYPDLYTTTGYLYFVTNTTCICNWLIVWLPFLITYFSFSY